MNDCQFSYNTKLKKKKKKKKKKRVNPKPWSTLNPILLRCICKARGACYEKATLLLAM